MNPILLHYTLILILGAITGSFLNVCIHRLPRGESLVKPRSRCPRCYTPLTPRDNLPVMSWLLLRGRCRTCNARISPRYLIVELLTAAIFLLFSLRFGECYPLYIIYTAFACSLIVVAFIDIEHGIIPDEISLGGMLCALAASAAAPLLHQTASHLTGFLHGITGAATGAGLLLLIRLGGRWFFQKEAMGMGDVKLMAFIGGVLGWDSVFMTVLLASLLGTAVGLFLIIRSRASLHSRIPFGPFLCLGALLTLLYNREILALLLHLT